MYLCFASTSKGLEQLLIEELTQIGATEASPVHAGVKFKADFNTIMKANLHSRLASRILIQVGTGYYLNEEDIYAVARNIDWEEWFYGDMKLKVATSAINSPLKSLEFINLKVKDGICDYFMAKYNRRPDVDKREPDMRILNFLTEDTVTIYLDTSDEALFKRGYREHKLEAPLKENLAAGLIKLSGWDYNTPLFDPMCGSGTIVVEAVMMALNIAPGLKRRFAFEKFNNFYQASWDTMKAEAKAAIITDKQLQIYASDINPKAVIQTEVNLRHAKLREYVYFETADFLNVTPPKTKPGIILTNPPYGVRMEELDELSLFYPKLASHLKNHYAGWNCYFFTSDLRMPKAMRLKPSRKTPLHNGALDCRLFEFKMVSGSNR